MPKIQAPILVLSAMPSETTLIQAALNHSQQGQLAIYPYHQGSIGSHQIITAVTGVGVTNAAMTAALNFPHCISL